MCSSVGLVVEGIPLGSGRQFSPRLTMKKEYNTRCFRPERYRHEVANHYRDYKLQQHLQQHQLGSGSGSLGHRRHRKRRRQFFERTAEVSRVSASLASGYAQFRDVWPIHVHYFPRSDDTTYAARGRRTVCSGEPPDDTYNDAVRRIRSAHSCEQLRHLVQRIPWRSTNCSAGSSDDQLPVAPAHGSQTSDSGRVRVNYKLNINKCPPAKAESPQQQPPIDFYGYLQLASGYYERGLQANIKYLQSIGQRQRRRNAIRPAPGLFLDAVQRGESPVRKLTGRLVTLLKSLRRKAAKEEVGDPGIWVNIRSVKRGEQEQEKEEDSNSDSGLNLNSNSEEEGREEPREGSASMRDYYAPGYTTTESGGATGASASSRATFASSAGGAAVAQATSTAADQRRLYEIIDNLSHLSIGDTGGSSSSSSSGVGRRQQLTLTLPQITLTDCTAQQVALYSASFDIVTLQIPNEARPPNLNLRAT
ncbi:uncharacterized protein LOC108043836 [Drosophila rhopaloa]|uniref:Uncharacterized protein n=1 Tax=Drosophila rhopaloa TaxID=1041015 RepID=A0ABM5HCF8_DRORH|nr:uncharacterized protein LOC108043836 [Drosophila rhopaloa]